VVFVTDARAIVARDGAAGRARAEDDALDAARRLRAARCASLVVDTSPRGAAFARRLAGEMGARYELLPYPESHRVSALARSLDLDGPASRAG
jgi:magnesium chelatase subunit D